MKFKHILSVIALAAVFTGCKKSDVEIPVIETFTVNGQAEEIEAAAGSTLTFSATLSDNQNLQQYKIDLHDAFDGHSHNKTSAYTRYSFLSIMDIEGTSHTVNETATIVADAAAGPYDIILNVLDEAGNEGAFKEVLLMVTRPDQAMVNVTSHDLSVDNNITAGSRLTLAGSITDDIDLVSIDISLSGTNGELYDQEFDLPGSADTNWDLSQIEAQGFPIDIPGTATSGEYHLNIIAVDADGNYTIAEGHFVL